ncbi:MAG: ferredoxin domain-containing protein [Macellibacteroides fermentans]|uniref:ferredoxin domain-containing protein n=1 Tax=Macellibacteroides fermentans TaxID=879969 RepID=UPI003ACBAC78
MIVNERESRHEHVLQVGRQMMTAARTAPKGKGIDIIEVGMVTDQDIVRLSEEMVRYSEESGMKFLLRDAENLQQAEAVIIIGTAHKVQGLNCAHCGYATCAEKPDAVPCAINTIDVGIAVGSACATAADCRVDSRVMFSAGMAAQRLGYLGDCTCVMAIPISASSKNPFFDRKPKTPVQ